MEIAVGAPDIFTLPPVSAGLLVRVQFAGANMPEKSACVPFGVVPFRLVDDPRHIFEGDAVTGAGAAGEGMTVMTLLADTTQPYRSVTVTVYDPEFAGPAFAIVGF